MSQQGHSIRVYFGTYTRHGRSKGIYRAELSADGQLSPPHLAAETADPSFLVIHPSRRFLYAVGEAAGGGRGAVNAFAIDAASGDLTPLNQQPSGGRGPCYVAIDQAGRNVLAANYGSGSVAVLPVDCQGRLGPPNAVQHHGSGPDASRQEGPHAHSINLEPGQRFALAADLGLDQVLVYRFDADAAMLTPNDPPAAALSPGAGPRHLAFHPAGRWVYVINEMASTITAFAYDPAAGSLTAMHTVSTLPEDANLSEENSTAEVAVHPNGRFVYGSNRGHDSLAIFAVDGPTGRLRHVGWQSTLGRTPRHFAIEPTGRFLLAAHQDSDNVVVFAIDAERGTLSPTGRQIAVPAAVCVRFAEMA